MCKEESEWMVAVYWEMVGSRILHNCWHKTGYEWFPSFVDQEDVVTANTGNINNGANGNDGGDNNEGNKDSYMSNEALLDSDKDSKDKGDD
jgi:hypothetical protein